MKDPSPCRINKFKITGDETLSALRKKMMNLANKLTLSRLILVPVFLIFTIIDTVWTRLSALLIFIVAALTDLCDGYFARKYQQVTDFGKLLDPLADKLLISAALVCFVSLKELQIPPWMIALIIGREFLITGLRLVAISKGKIISADRSGKFKTSFQLTTVIAILLILCMSSALNHFCHIEPTELLQKSGWSYFAGALLVWLPYWLVFITTLFTLISGFSYLRRNHYLFSAELGNH